MERTSWTETAARFRRRHHYMSNNRDGAYSAQDLALTRFSSEIADILAKCCADGIKKHDSHKTADERYKLRCRLGELLHDEKEEDPKIGTIQLIQDDERFRLIEIEDLEFQIIILSYSSLSQDLDNEDQEAEKRAYRVATTKDPTWKHRFSHVMWYETATREDITSEEDQNFNHLLDMV